MQWQSKKSTSIKLVLVRHPETEGNILSNGQAAKLRRPNHLFQPTKKGLDQVAQAIELYSIMKNDTPSIIYCSTATRTRILAEKFREHFGKTLVNIAEDSRLNEKWDGIFHSMSAEDIAKKYPDQIELRKKYGWYHFKPFGGENAPDVELRIRSFLSDLGENPFHTNKTVILCVHGNWQFIFEKIAENRTWQETEIERATNPIPNCSITGYRFEPPSRFSITHNRRKHTSTPNNTNYA